jgi:hypothetical protein
MESTKQNQRERQKQAARQAQAQAKDEGRTAGARRGRDWRRNRGLADRADLEEQLGSEQIKKRIKPVIVRNAVFPGEAGKEVWKELQKTAP